MEIVAGLVLVNPATKAQPDDVVAMLQEMVDDGNTVMPGIGSDIADPDVAEIAYEGTPLVALLSLQNDGLAPMAERYGELKMPVLLYTSHNDHVVPPESSEHLAATVGGELDHVWLDRSFHVATQDYDRDTITIWRRGVCRPGHGSLTADADHCTRRLTERCGEYPVAVVQFD